MCLPHRLPLCELAVRPNPTLPSPLQDHCREGAAVIMCEISLDGIRWGSVDTFNAALISMRSSRGDKPHLLRVLRLGDLCCWDLRKPVTGVGTSDCECGSFPETPVHQPVTLSLSGRSNTCWRSSDSRFTDVESRLL